jgi:hypothetical protein
MPTYRDIDAKDCYKNSKAAVHSLIKQAETWGEKTDGCAEALLYAQAAEHAAKALEIISHL